MKALPRATRIVTLLSLLGLCSSLVTAAPLGTAFTYQGKLASGGQAANGLYDLQFSLYDAATGGAPLTATFQSNAVGTTNGLFTVALDFGAAFDGTARWLEIGVRTNGGGAFTTLVPRQPLTPAPYAIMANGASNLLGLLPASQLTGAAGAFAVTNLTVAGNLNLPATGGGAGVVYAGGLPLLHSSGGGNFFAGIYAGNLATSGTGNTADGVEALNVDTTGSQNTALGYSALIGNTSGSGNTALGYQALLNNVSGNNNIAVGAGAGANVTGSGNIDIGNVGAATDTNVIRIGNSLVIRQDNTNGAPNVILGSPWNVISNGVIGATISGGGATNENGLALAHLVSGDFATVGGGWANYVQASGATIGGGGANVILATASDATISGGAGHTIETNARQATIGGGGGNWIRANANIATIAGGYQNTIDTNAERATISGGSWNEIWPNASVATIGGGHWNQATNVGATVSGGWANFAGGRFSAVGGGEVNQTTSSFATVPGGYGNVAGGQYSFAAGQQAQAIHDGSFVWADALNTNFVSTTTNQFSVRAGGGVRFVTSGAGMILDGQPVLTSGGASGLTIQQNTNGAPNVILGASANYVADGVVGATIGGGGATNFGGSSYHNRVTADFGTVGGGGGNTASDLAATVSGGEGNTASNPFATVGGGHLNLASGWAATVGGGSGNLASAGAATVGGGFENTASGGAATVGGGNGNHASGDSAAVGGGAGNNATNDWATVPGGYNNVAGGQYSFAAGQQANALNDGCFVWADSQGVPFASTANDQFLIRAHGGVGINKNNPATALDVNGAVKAAEMDWGSAAYLRNDQGGVIELGDSSLAGTTPYVDFHYGVSGFQDYNVRLINSANNQLDVFSSMNGATPMMRLNPGGLTVNGTFVSSSDRNVKENFQALDPQTVLAKVAALPITSWNFKDDPATPHLGPMAQDFYAAFQVGPDDKHITTVDEGGVALAAIQGLNQKMEDLKTEIQRRDAENAALKRRLEKLERLLSQRSDTDGQ